MASINRRTDSRGAPSFQLRWRAPDGSQHSQTFTSMAAARQRKAELELQLASGTFVDPRAGDVSVRAFAQAWAAAQTWKIQTRRRRVSILENHVYPAIGDRPLGSIRPSEIQAIVARTSTTHAPASVKVLITTIKPLFAAAAGDRLIAISPAAGLRAPAGARAAVMPVKRVLERGEVAALGAAMAPGYEATVTVGAGLGLRPGELLALRRGSVNFLRREITIDAGVIIGEHGPELAPPKTARSVRVVPAPDLVLAAIAEHIRLGYAGDILLFAAERTAGIMRPNTYRRIYGQAAKVARCSWSSPHDLRHFAASSMIRGGASAAMVAAALGDSIATVLATYSHHFPSDDARVRELLAAGLG